MSTAGAATLAVVRETASGDDDVITKSDTGTSTERVAARWTDILAKLVPTGMIGSYSFLIGVIIALIEDPTEGQPAPNEYIGFRIALWALFIALTFGYSYAAYVKRRSAAVAAGDPRRRFPWELVASTFAFAAWGMSTPGSWVIDSLDSSFWRVVAPTGIAVVAVLILGIFSDNIRSKLPTR